MMKTTIFACIVGAIVLGAIGCGSPAQTSGGVPDSLLVGVIVEVFSATARAELNGTDPGIARQEALAKFGLDTMALSQTLKVLAEDPDSAAVVYQRALDSLVVIQRGLRSVPELDSLSRAVRG